jgi:hypothetical protein
VYECVVGHAFLDVMLKTLLCVNAQLMFGAKKGKENFYSKSFSGKRTKIHSSVGAGKIDCRIKHF